VASYLQTPGSLSLSFVRGDDFSALIDLSIDMTGYTTTASISSAVTGALVVPLTVTTVSASEGKVNLSLTDSQTSAMARGTYTWSMSWTEGGGTRTALTGTCEVL
jgi:hypothetical protein